MNEFIERQISLSLESICKYKEGNLTLNRLVLSLEAFFALEGMEVIRKNTQESVSGLEEINAYLFENGEFNESIKLKLKEMIDEIARQLEMYK